MSKNTAEDPARQAEREAALRPHLSALVDGELEPLEAIALQQHMRQSPALLAEYRELERLKLAVHLAGKSQPAPAALGELLETRCRAALRAKAEKARAARWVFPLGLIGAAALGILVMQRALTPKGHVPEAQVALELPSDPSDLVLARLVDFHREGRSPMVLSDLLARGALVTIERLPDSFIVPEGQRPQLVQASYMGCSEREGGATLAVLRVNRVELPQRIDNALETTGVYVDTVGGVQVRMSVSGDKLFVLLSGDSRGESARPI